MKTFFSSIELRVRRKPQNWKNILQHIETKDFFQIANSTLHISAKQF